MGNDRHEECGKGGKVRGWREWAGRENQVRRAEVERSRVTQEVQEGR